MSINLQELISSGRNSWTRKEAAAYLAMSVQFLASDATTGRHGVPYIKVGRSVRYRKADLDAWLASRTVNNNGDAAKGCEP